MNDNRLILFPGALGDFICFWPLLDAAREQTRGRVSVVANPELLTLLPRSQFDGISIHRREVADLFASSPPAASTVALFSGFAEVHSWTGHESPGFAQRLAEITGAHVHVHPFRGMLPSEHATAYYARCLGVAPKTAPPPLEEAAQSWAQELWEAHGLDARTLVYHPGSGSRRKNWIGINAVTSRWRALKHAKLLCLLGPADDQRSAGDADLTINCESLPRVAALLGRASLYLGNDSGISHLAGLLGTPSVVLFGPSDPIPWRPLGPRTHLLVAASPCPECGPDRFCAHRLAPDLVLSTLLAVAS